MVSGTFPGRGDLVMVAGFIRVVGLAVPVELA